jgi:hypothetical protein
VCVCVFFQILMVAYLVGKLFLREMSNPAPCSSKVTIATAGGASDGTTVALLRIQADTESTSLDKWVRSVCICMICRYGIFVL